LAEGKERGITTAVVVAAFVVLSVGVLVALWLGVRRRPVARDVQTTLVGIDTRLTTIDERIESALRTRGDSRELGTRIAETLDLDEVLQRTLAAAHAVGPVDGGRVAVRLPNDTMVTATSGLVTSGTRTTLDGPPDGSEFTHGSFSWEVPDPNGLRSGLVVPMAGGSLAIFSRASDAFGPDGAVVLSTIARRAEPAVVNAIAHLAVLERAATDLLTGLGSASAFAEALPRAISASRRTNRPLCLIQIDLDDFGKINNEHPRKYDAGNDALAGFGRRLLATIRGSDAPFRNSGGADEFFLILPETTLEEAKLSYARIAFEMAAAPFGDVSPIRMSSGLVQLRSEDTEAMLKSRTGALVGKAKDHGKNRLCSDDGEEWVAPH
jgi:diguanylate cyclase (GGDEF)-like protein